MGKVEFLVGPLTRKRLSGKTKDELISEVFDVHSFAEMKEKKRAEWEKKLADFGSYVLSCRKSNTQEWMEGLADELTSVSKSLCEHKTYKFNGDGITETP